MTPAAVDGRKPAIVVGGIRRMSHHRATAAVDLAFFAGSRRDDDGCLHVRTVKRAGEADPMSSLSCMQPQEAL